MNVFTKLFKLASKLPRKAYDLWRKASHPVIHFACSIGGYYTSSPVSLSRTFRPEWFKKQAEDKSVKFVRCPGMFDIMQQGYIIYAHADIHIKATAHSVHVKMPMVNGNGQLMPAEMDMEIVKGIAPYEGVKPMIWKIPMPWGIHMPEGYSAHVMPAFMHAPHLYQHLFVFPGTVDYSEFNTCNFIFTAIRPCDIVIPQGTPLVHILPFKREDFHATSGPATQLQRDRHMFGFQTRVMGAYRRLHLKKKIYTIEVTK